MGVDDLGGMGKLAAIFLVLMVSLDIYGRATGQSVQLDVLNPTNWGASMNAAARKLAASQGATATPTAVHTGTAIPGQYGGYSALSGVM